MTPVMTAILCVMLPVAVLSLLGVYGHGTPTDHRMQGVWFGLAIALLFCLVDAGK